MGAPCRHHHWPNGIAAPPCAHSALPRALHLRPKTDRRLPGVVVCRCFRRQHRRRLPPHSPSSSSTTSSGSTPSGSSCSLATRASAILSKRACSLELRVSSSFDTALLRMDTSLCGASARAWQRTFSGLNAAFSVPVSCIDAAADRNKSWSSI